MVLQFFEVIVYKQSNGAVVLRLLYTIDLMVLQFWGYCVQQSNDAAVLQTDKIKDEM